MYSIVKDKHKNIIKRDTSIKPTDQVLGKVSINPTKYPIVNFYYQLRKYWIDVLVDGQILTIHGNFIADKIDGTTPLANIFSDIEFIPVPHKKIELVAMGSPRMKEIEAEQSITYLHKSDIKPGYIYQDKRGNEYSILKIEKGVAYFKKYGYYYTVSLKPKQFVKNNGPFDLQKEKDDILKEFNSPNTASWRKNQLQQFL